MKKLIFLFIFYVSLSLNAQNLVIGTLSNKHYQNMEGYTFAWFSYDKSSNNKIFACNYWAENKNNAHGIILINGEIEKFNTYTTGDADLLKNFSNKTYKVLLSINKNGIGTITIKNKISNSIKVIKGYFGSYVELESE